MKRFKTAALPPHTNKNQFTAQLGLDSAAAKPPRIQSGIAYTGFR